MQLKYKFFQGGDWNPFEKEMLTAYEKLTAEREVADPERAEPLESVFPRLDSWADYVIANSKSVFWQMERDICSNGPDGAADIESLWKEAKDAGAVGEWLMRSEAEESEKAMCYYMASQHRRFDPGDKAVDFRLYISEGIKARELQDDEGFSLEPYM